MIDQTHASAATGPPLVKEDVRDRPPGQQVRGEKQDAPAVLGRGGGE